MEYAILHHTYLEDNRHEYMLKTEQDRFEIEDFVNELKNNICGVRFSLDQRGQTWLKVGIHLGENRHPHPLYLHFQKTRNLKKCILRVDSEFSDGEWFERLVKNISLKEQHIFD